MSQAFAHAGQRLLRGVHEEMTIPLVSGLLSHIQLASFGLCGVIMNVGTLPCDC